jgi:hypothetical protein
MKKNNGSCKDIRIMARVVGFYTEVNSWNPGKNEEFKMRKTFDIWKAVQESEEPEPERSALTVVD